MEKVQNSVAGALSLAHAALLEDLQKLREAIDPASEVSVPVLRARLGLVQAHITEHFCFEEQNGYMDQVRKRAPNLEGMIQALAQEHGQLARSLNGLIESARTAKSLDSPLRMELRDWIRQVHEHEAHETDLVQDVFNLDFGTED